MKNLAIIFLLVGGLSGLARGQQDTKAGTTAAQFLKIGVGARSMALGGATAGTVNDASAMYWNVSGLTSVHEMTLHATHTQWFAGMSHQFFGIVLPVSDDHVFGVHATILDAGEMEVTTVLEARGTGDLFSATDVCVGVSYAARLTDFFSFGVSAKFVSQSLSNESASAVAADLATTLRTGYQGITIGMAFTNFGTTLKLEGRDLHRTYDPNPSNATNTGVSSHLATESWDLPLNFRVGIGWTLVGDHDAMLIDESMRLQLGLDANHPNDGRENIVAGVEWSWMDMLALRGGYHFNDLVRSWSAGTGLKYASPGSISIGVDYAYNDMDRLGAVHVISLAIGL